MQKISAKERKKSCVYTYIKTIQNRCIYKLDYKHTHAHKLTENAHAPTNTHIHIFMRIDRENV